MILLLTSIGDLSCDLVIDWLDSLGHKYYRINSFDILDKKINIEFKDGKVLMQIGSQILDLDDINVIWFRKFGFFESSDVYKEAWRIFNPIDPAIANHLLKEFNKIISFIILLMKDKRWLTDPQKIKLNKLDVLRHAFACGLHTPESKIINDFLSTDLKNEEWIVKSIYDPILIRFYEKRFMTYTNVLNIDSIDKMSNSFFPSFVQKKIEKKYEVRVFYLDGKCYSMAIFSQKDPKTKVDFRRYNYDNPNRTVPYKLPKSECLKIKKLMKSMGLNCGSIDLIKSHDDKYYFLEVNPTGQFGMVDFPCNYGLHRKVAEKLIELDKK